MVRNARQEGAHHGGFARGHFPGQLNEASGFVDAVQQMRQSFGVALAQIEIARVRRDGEGLFVEAEEAEVHDCPRIPTQPPDPEPRPGNRLARVRMSYPNRPRMLATTVSKRDP